MKTTAMFLTVILLMAAAIFMGRLVVEKKEAKVYTHDLNRLKEDPLKEDKTTPLQQPVYKQGSPPRVEKIDLIGTYIKTSVCDGPDPDYALIPTRVKEDSNSIEENDDNELLMCNLSTEAEYPGGIEAWRRYLSKNVRCSEDTTVEESQVTVMVKFVIDEEGNVCEVEAAGGSKLLCAEAERVIKQSKKWIPGRQLSNGRVIRSFKKQPVIFRFQTED